jgi:hypothetical protein
MFPNFGPKDISLSLLHTHTLTHSLSLARMHMYRLSYDMKLIIHLSSGDVITSQKLRVIILPILSIKGVNKPNKDKDGGSPHLWNVGLLQQDYTVVYPRKLSS